jgi:hypothetical protein
MSMAVGLDLLTVAFTLPKYWQGLYLLAKVYKGEYPPPAAIYWLLLQTAIWLRVKTIIGLLLM